MITVTVNITGVRQFEKSLNMTHVQVNTKCQLALNRTLQRSRTRMTNAVGDKLNLKKRTIRELVSIQKANKNTGLIGKLTVKNKPVPLIEYNAKQNRKGVSFKVFKDRPRQLVKHAFITPDSRNRMTVFRREFGAGRLRIKPLYGSTVMYVAKDRIQVIKDSSLFFLTNEVRRLVMCGLNI